MLRVFNCGIGMIVIGDSESEGAMNELGYKRIGYIKKNLELDKWCLNEQNPEEED